MATASGPQSQVFLTKFEGKSKVIYFSFLMLNTKFFGNIR